MGKNNRCKICNLEDGLKGCIDNDIVKGMGAPSICRKYPDANINESNVYSHRNHLASSQARDKYERSLQEKVDSNFSSLATIPLESASPSNSPGLSDNQSTPTILVKRSETRMALERATTGNRILDDVAILDMIIAQAEDRLADVTIKDILEAIKLKHQLLDGSISENDAERSNKTVLKIGTILNIVARMENGEKIETETLDMDSFDKVLEK